MESVTAEKIAKSIIDQSAQRNKTVFIPIGLCSILLFAIFSAVPSWSASSEDSFKQGNAAYNDGKFSDALSFYESAQQNGLHHWMLDYNLGNAYYKTGQLGKAIVHYVRAFRVNSGSSDVIDNLNLTTTKAGDPLLPQSALPAFLWRLFYLFSLNTLTVAASLFFITLCAGAGLALLDRWKPTLELTVAACGVFVLLGSWLGTRIYFFEEPEAIVITASADVRSGPNLSYPANFTVPEGHHLLILDEQEPVTGWLEVGVPDQGLKGWVPTSSVETL
jgi:tetratricopeptide (TPR) repeat protein